MFLEDPGPPWIKGRPPWQPQNRPPEQYKKASETIKRRLREQGHTQAELEGYKKQSETRKSGNYSPSEEVRLRISKTLTGRPQKWEENKSRASCRLAGCDIVYDIKLVSPEGKSFGKWGSTKQESFIFRVKEFRRIGFHCEIVFWKFFGNETEDTEAFLGRRLAPHRDPEIPHFYGHTETFAWNNTTKEIVEVTCNELEKDSPPKGNW